MSVPSDISSTGAEAKILGAICAGAVRALRTRADKQRQMSADGTSTAGEQFSDVVVRSPEAAMAANLAAEFERLACEIEAGALL